MTETTRDSRRRESGSAHEFDADTAVQRIADDRFAAELSGRWGIGPALNGRAAALNGGYGMAVAVRALGAALDGREPLTVTGHFLGALQEGPAEIDVRVAKEGWNLSTAHAELRQDGRERLRVLGTFGDMPGDPAPRLVDGGPPDLPPPEDCVGNEPGVANPFGIPIGDRFLYRAPAEDGGRLPGQPAGETRLRAWARFADGRDADLLGLVCLVDALPPAISALDLDGWTPTIELTVHLRARPAPGWLAVALRTRFVQSGFFEEDAEVWDSGGRLVAQSRQLARLPQ